MMGDPVLAVIVRISGGDHRVDCEPTGGSMIGVHPPSVCQGSCPNTTSGCNSRIMRLTWLRRSTVWSSSPSSAPRNRTSPVSAETASGFALLGLSACDQRAGVGVHIPGAFASRRCRSAGVRSCPSQPILPAWLRIRTPHRRDARRWLEQRRVGEGQCAWLRGRAGRHKILNANRLGAGPWPERPRERSEQERESTVFDQRRSPCAPA